MRHATAIDLFSGVGGLTEGLKQAGFDVLGAVEIDATAVESYCLNHPQTTIFPVDIRYLDPTAVMQELNLQPGQLSLLAGCPPCQGYSTLRTRQRGPSVPDERNSLVFEFLRFARALLPRAVMLENVPNLARDDRIQAILSGLSDLGYNISDDSIRILDASRYGVPQRRKRMILMAARDGSVSFASELEHRAVVRDAIFGLNPPGMGDDPLHDYHVRRHERIQRMIESIPKDGGSRTDLPLEFQLQCHRRTTGFRDVYGRMAWDKPAPTITGGCFNPSRGRFLHPEQNRAITLREAALLQTFPPCYQFSTRATRQEIALFIGNALPPEFIRRQASSLLDSVIRKESTRVN